MPQKIKITEAIDIGSNLEPFIDDFLIQKLSRSRLVLHRPTPREVAIVHDEPWEGNTSAYWTVFPDGNRFRMYYRGVGHDFKTGKTSKEVVCYAESKDGKTWTKPELGLFDFRGSKKNNIVWKGFGTHNFAPFKDSNPQCKRSHRYKALASHQRGLVAFKSSDGIQWSLIQDEPVITKGAFDSQNLAFWDSARECYVDFHRGFRPRRGKGGVRDIMTCTSSDFINWTEPEWLDFGSTPPEHLYTNAVTPYPRAPHICVGFPKRFVPTRQPPHHPTTGISDTVFMTSRDGLQWRRWTEAFIRPGLQKERWVNRNNMTAWGILETKADTTGCPDELSIYSSEGYYQKDCRMRRFTLRKDGFVSVQADGKGGEMVTKPFNFEGRKLSLNFSTSAAGGVRVELQTPSAKAIRGFSLDDCDEIFGDELERDVTWNGKSSLASIRQPVRVRFVISDADLYAMQFRA